MRGIVVLGALWLSLVAAAQSASTWTVKPEWVKAHEEFLASDVLDGRGSASRDEEIAATYVASEFEGYGLQHPPGMAGYLQQAAGLAVALDGHAVLSAGPVTLEEGRDFTLLLSPGRSVKGELQHVAIDGGSTGAIHHGAAALAGPLPPGAVAMQAAGVLRHGGAAALVLVPDDESTRSMYTHLGGHTRVPVRLTDETPEPGGSTLVALNAPALEQLRRLKDATEVALRVQPQPDVQPRATFNALGWLPGSDPAAGTILLTAHLDHLGVGRPVNGDAIYNGANDDASGTTAVLELAHALAAGPRPRRNVLFVCYGSEEIGELGSTYFGEHPPVPLKSLVTNLEFEMIGNQDPKMPRGILSLTGWGRSNLGPTLKQHGALLGPDPYPEEHFFERSDNYSLALRGIVAHTASGWGTVPTYHRPDDDLQHLNLPFMTEAIQSLVEPLRWLASSDFVPQWNKGGQPKGR